MAQFTQSQLDTAYQVLAAVPQATPTEQLALMEAGLTESGMQNLNHGDRDSQGVFQERPSQGWQNVMNIHDATVQMFNAMNKNLTDPGAMAQSGERSAYPARYDQHQAEAMALLAAVHDPANIAKEEASVNSQAAQTAGGAVANALGAGDLVSGIENWIGSWAARVGLMVMGVLFILVGIYIAFKDTGAGKIAKTVGKAAMI